ncbi:MAG: sulfatase-like hydrolase/transferase [bacterium]|nr:sulfatase-like hydrolase/transferase [bacterium]
MNIDIKSPKFLKQILGLLAVLLIIIGITIFSIKTNNIAEGNNRPMLPVGIADTLGSLDANSVFISGAYAYVVTDNNTGTSPEFYVIDISLLQIPRIVGSYDINVSVNKVYVSGNYAYLTTKKDTEDIVVLNITNKSQPTKVTSINIPNNSEALAILGVGSNLYVGFANSYANKEFYIINISNPATPQIIGSYEVGGAVNDIALTGNYVYLATSNNTKELTVLNVATSSNPTQVSSFDIPVNGGANALAISGEKVYLVTNNNASQPDFFIVNAPIGSTSTLLSSLDLDTSNTDITVIGSVAFVSTQTSAKSIIKIDASNPASPFQVFAYDGGARANEVTTDVRYLYIASTNNTKEFQVLDSQEVPLARPNIVLILTDDQTPNSLDYMPIVQRELVNKGVKFTNGFVTTGLCCPSRVSIQTGQYVHNHHIITNSELQSGASAFMASPGATSNIATWLHDAGYSTGYFGKYLNGYNLVSPTIPAGWDKWNVFKGDPATGDDNYYNYTLNEDGIEKTYISNLDTNTEYYATDLLASRTVDFIKSKANKPFFVVYAPYGPHSPTAPAPRHIDTLKNLPLWRPPSWNELDMSDKSPWWQATSTRSSPYVTSANLDALKVREIETLLSVDDAVGSIISALETAGVSDNTIIVYLSDNGFSWGEHWYYGKNCQYDECSKVPFIVRYPALGIIPRVDNRFVLNIDIAPTFAELAGITPPSKVNGRSFLKLLTNSDNSWRNDFLLEGWNSSTTVQSPPTYANVRNSQWEYIKSNDGGTFEELYNIVQDPYELVNVAGNPNNATILSEMRARLLQLQAE